MLFKNNLLKIFVLFSFFLLFMVNLANGKKNGDTICIKRNSAFLEGFGTGGLYSLNYERIVYYRPKFKIAARAGFGFIPGNDFASVPVEVNMIRGYENCFEFGLSSSYIKGLQKGTVFERDIDNFIGDYITESIYCSFRIGYRYQRKDGGFILRIGFTPLFKIHEFNHLPKHLVKNQPVWGGICFGYTF